MCSHQWVKVHEQALFGGSFPVGWQCLVCNKYVSLSEVTPAGLPGVTTKKHRLVGVHGNKVVSATGKACRSQIYDEDTKEITYED